MNRKALCSETVARRMRTRRNVRDSALRSPIGRARSLSRAFAQQNDADRYEEIARVKSEKGAKTAIFVPELNRLYVAVAGKGAVKAGVLQYEVLPAAK